MMRKVNFVKSATSAVLLATQAQGLQMRSNGDFASLLDSFLNPQSVDAKGLGPQQILGGMGNMLDATSWADEESQQLTPAQLAQQRRQEAEQKRQEALQYKQWRITGESDLSIAVEHLSELERVSCLSDVVYAFDRKHESSVNESITAAERAASEKDALKCLNQTATSASVQFIDVSGLKCVMVKTTDNTKAWADCAGMRKREVPDFLVHAVPESLQQTARDYVSAVTEGHVRENLFEKLLGGEGKVAFKVEDTVSNTSFGEDKITGAQITSEALHTLAAGVHKEFENFALHNVTNNFQLSGHSLGGAVAHGAYWKLLEQQVKNTKGADQRKVTLLTFAAPPVGNKAFEALVRIAEKKRLNSSKRFQFINEGDFVGKLTKENLEMMSMFGGMMGGEETDLNEFRSACYAPDSYTKGNLTLPSATRVEGMTGIVTENHSLPAYQEQIAFAREHAVAIRQAAEKARKMREQQRARQQKQQQAREQMIRQHSQRNFRRGRPASDKFAGMMHHQQGNRESVLVN